MLDYYDISGCFILKVRHGSWAREKHPANLFQPASYFIWEEIQQFLNHRIKRLGVRNCSFPLFVSEDVLQKEKDHIEGFAAEVAWVTHAYGVSFSSTLGVAY
jgi:prolyl-tRNA synthetase